MPRLQHVFQSLADLLEVAEFLTVGGEAVVGDVDHLAAAGDQLLAEVGQAESLSLGLLIERRAGAVELPALTEQLVPQLLELLELRRFGRTFQGVAELDESNIRPMRRPPILVWTNRRHETQPHQQ